MVPTPCSFPKAKIHITPNLSSSVKMSKLGLLSAGLSAVLGKDVIVQEGGTASLSIHDVFKQTYTMKPPGFRPPSGNPEQETFSIFVKSLCRSCYGNDNTITLQVTKR